MAGSAAFGHFVDCLRFRNIGKAQAFRGELDIGLAQFPRRPQIGADAVIVCDAIADMKWHGAAAGRGGNIASVWTVFAHNSGESCPEPLVPPQLARHAKHCRLLLDFTVAAQHRQRRMRRQAGELLACFGFDVGREAPYRQPDNPCWQT